MVSSLSPHSLHLIFDCVLSILALIWLVLVDWCLRLFTTALADGISLESEWEQVSPGLQDSSQYASQSQQCYGLNGLDSPSDFQFRLSLFQALEECSKCTIIGITVTFMFHSFLNSLARSKYLFICSHSLIFTLWSAVQQNPSDDKFFLLVD